MLCPPYFGTFGPIADTACRTLPKVSFSLVRTPMVQTVRAESSEIRPAFKSSVALQFKRLGTMYVSTLWPNPVVPARAMVPPRAIAARAALTHDKTRRSR
jgi:hypothetical protein